ncbi:TBC1 domain family member 10A-like [Tachysurus vachellii]|uniref:TBC1 domain family member 10A-like n=1 Tax=Tachysurus vachellii TaxID=175792 RepID=UPI00296B0944|nr:TBC1 domain family member 10A-like [Tachysurus vachellii]
MAEVSALTPSPPAVADQPVPPPSSSSAPSLPAESPKPIAVPKSALYGDRAVMASAALIPPRKETSVRLSNSGEAITALSENPPPVPSASESTCLPDRGKESFPTTPEPLMQPNISPEPQGRAADPEAPPFPEQNPTTQLNLTSNSTSSSHTPPRSPPSIVPIIHDPLSDLKSDLPSLMVHDSFVPYTVPPPGQSGPALDTLSYLESASMMSGTLESLSGIGEDGSSLGSDSELNGPVQRRTDKYGFLGGSQYSEGNVLDISVEVARHREMKWLDMFKNWDKWVSRRFPKVKLRCRKGIPSSLRARAWQLLSNSEELLMANVGKFEELEREPGDPKWLDIIEKDLHRQFPFHEMFAARGGHGQQDLYRILKAYTIYRPEEGYCQAQAPVAAVLLMHMPAEQAFWCLVQICEKYLPGYYSAGLEAIQLDGEIFFSLLRRVCPMAYRHLKKYKIDPILYMTEWFMCIFSRTLPWSCVLRVWDMFFCEGVKIVFRVGLVLLKQMLGSVDKLRELQGMYETMERLRNISPESIREEILVQEVTAVPVTEALIERECTIQVKKWRESRGALTHQPARRLHGTRDIHEQKRRAAAISSGGSLSFLGSSMSAPPPGPLRSSSSLLSLPGFRKSKNPFSHGKKSSFSGPFVPETQVFGGGTPIMITSSSAPLRPPVSAMAPPTGGAGGNRPSPLVTKPPTSPKSPVAIVGPGPISAPKSRSEQTSAPKSEPQTASAPKSEPQTASAPKSEPQTASAPKSEPQTASAPKSEPQTAPEIVSQPTSEPAPKSSKESAHRPIPNQLQPPRVVSEQVTPTIPSPTANNMPLPPCEDEGKKKKRSKDEKKKEKEEEKQKAREKKEREKSEKEKAKKEKEKKKEKGGKKKDKSASAEAEEKNGATAGKKVV